MALRAASPRRRTWPLVLLVAAIPLVLLGFHLSSNDEHVGLLQKGAVDQVVNSSPDYFAYLGSHWAEPQRQIQEFCSEASAGHSLSTDPVFYPMSGFDVMWLLSCFPHAERYVMAANQPAFSTSNVISDNAAHQIRGALHDFVNLWYLTTANLNKAGIDATTFFAVGLKVLFQADFEKVCPPFLPAHTD